MTKVAKAMCKEMKDIKQKFLQAKKGSFNREKFFKEFRDIRFTIYQLLYRDFITSKEANKIGEIWLQLKSNLEYEKNA